MYRSDTSAPIMDYFHTCKDSAICNLCPNTVQPQFIGSLFSASLKYDYVSSLLHSQRTAEASCICQCITCKCQVRKLSNIHTSLNSGLSRFYLIKSTSSLSCCMLPRQHHVADR